MKDNLSETMRSVLGVATTVFVVLVLLLLLFRILQPFFFIFLTAFILSVFLNPVFMFLNRRCRLPKTLSAIAAIFISMIIVSIPFSIIVTLLVRETGEVLNFVQENAGTRNELTHAIYGYLNQWGISTKNLEIEVNKYIINSLRFVSTSLITLLSQTLGLVLNTLLTLLVTFYFLMNKESIIQYVFNINLLSQADTKRLTLRATEVMTATIRGNLIVITIQAALAGVGFYIFGLSSPVLLGALYGLVSLVPVVGISLVWIPASAYLILSGNIVNGVGIALWCAISNLLMDNFISPKIVASETRLHPLFILFGVLGGVQMFGLFGIILGPTIIALSFVAIDMHRQLLQ